MGLEEQMPVPNYTTLSNTILSEGQGDLDVEAQNFNSGQDGSEKEEVHLVVDSTGLRVYGEGEWKQSVYGKQKQRAWRKLHLGVDSDTGEITAVGLAGSTSHDGSQVEKLLDQTPVTRLSTCDQTLYQTDKELSAVGGDGACDTWDVYDAITDREATPVIPRRGTPESRRLKLRRTATAPDHRFCGTRQALAPAPASAGVGSELTGTIVGAWQRRRSTGSGRLTGRFVEARRWENEKDTMWNPMRWNPMWDPDVQSSVGSFPKTNSTESSRVELSLQNNERPCRQARSIRKRKAPPNRLRAILHLPRGILPGHLSRPERAGTAPGGSWGPTARIAGKTSIRRIRCSGCSASSSAS